MSVAVEPAARTFRLEELVSLVNAGRIRVPHFQRGLRWGPSDAADLVDSILRGFPVGSLLLWRRAAPKEEVQLGDLRISAPAVPDALWVVDGQQRITSLVNALSPDVGETGMFALRYDVARAKVRRPSPHDAGTIPLPVLFDLRALLAWIQEHPDFADRINTINDAAARLREFHIPAYVVESDDENALKEIFDRMNNSGKRLSRAEVFSALFAPPSEDADRAISIDRIGERVYESSWGRIDADTLLRVILARRGFDVAREIRLEFDADRRPPSEFPNESRDEAYAGGEEALVRTVRFLRDRAGVPHFVFLPYRYLLVVLSRFFAHFPEPDDRNIELLVRWFWQAALLGPTVFKANVTGAMRSLGALIKPGYETESVQALLKAFEGQKPQAPDLTRFRANQAATRVVLCAMWSAGPRSLVTGEPISGSALALAIEDDTTAKGVSYEIVPRAELPEPIRAFAANRLLATDVEGADTPMQALTEPPLFENSWSETLASHALTKGLVALLANEKLSEFIEERTKILRNLVTGFLEVKAATHLEATPPLRDLDLDEAADRDDALGD